jgi:hypothetical protein
MAEDTKQANSKAALAVEEQEVKKKSRKAPGIPEAGNTEQLEKLRKEIEHLQYLKKMYTDKNAELQKESDQWKKKYFETKTALEKAVADNMKDQLDKNKSPDAAGEFLKIVAIPPKGVKPNPVRVNGIPALCNVDEDGFHIFTVPRSNAIRLLACETGTKYVLVGPVGRVDAIIPSGLYTKSVTFVMHTKSKDATGTVKWFPKEYI